MKIFDSNLMEFGIFYWNRFKFGFLNKKIILLLRNLKIEENYFEELLEKNILEIDNLSYEDENILKYFNWDDL